FRDQAQRARWLQDRHYRGFRARTRAWGHRLLRARRRRRSARFPRKARAQLGRRRNARLTRPMKLNAAHSAAPVRDLARLASYLEDSGCDGLYFADLSHDALLGAAVASTGTARMAIGTSIA